MKNQSYPTHAIELSKPSLALTILIVGCGCLILMIPTLWIGWFSIPLSDDLSRGAADTGYWQGVTAWYQYHNGRYFNAMIANYNKLYQADTYRLLFLPLCLILFCSIIIFTRAHFKLTGTSVRYAWIIGLILFIGALAGIPKFGAWLYWYASSSVYLLAASSLLLLYVCMVNAWQGQRHYWIIAGLLTFVASGSHEISMLAQLGLIVPVVILAIICKPDGWRYSLLTLVLSVLSACGLIFSPGSSNRSDIIGLSLNDMMLSIISNPFSFILTVLSDMGNAMHFWFANGQIFSVMIGGFLLGLSVSSAYSKTKLAKLTLVVFSLSFISLFSMCSIRFLLDGKMPLAGINRAVNLIWFIVYMQGFACAFVFGQCFKLKFLTSSLVVPVVSLGLITTSMMQSNINYLWLDLRQAKAQRVHEAWVYREQEINNQLSGKQIVVSGLPKIHSNVINEFDLTYDPGHEINNAYKLYYKVENQKQLSRRSFDYRLISHMAQTYQADIADYALSIYKDEHRKYLLFQFPLAFKTSERFHITQRTQAQVLNGAIIDEDALVEFHWNNGELEDSFLSRFACQDWEKNRFCRMPLGRTATGTLDIQWLGKTTTFEL